MRIEVLHVRDPDEGCEIVVYVDGEPVAADVVSHVDAGRGYDQADWDEVTASYAADATLSPAFREAVVRNRDEYRTNRYIDHQVGGG